MKLAQNRIFKHVRLYEAWKIGFEVEISTFEKSSEIRSGGARWLKTIPWGPGMVWNHSGPSRMHYKSFHRKKFFDFFSIFFKHFSKDFCLFLKDLSCTSRKKSIFFKNKPCMKNPLVEKLDMVPYFTPLASLEVKSKFERQVRFWN